MNAGRLDRKILFMEHSTTTDTFGQEKDVFTPGAIVWAEKRDVVANEAVEADQITANVRTEFIIRWRSDVLPTWRIRYDSKDYNIRGILEIGRREGLRIITEQKDSPR